MVDSARTPILKRRDLWITAGIVALVVISLAALAAATGWQDVARSLSQVSASQVLLLMFLSLWNYVLRGARWHLFSRVLDLPVSLRQSFGIYLGGLAMTVTPGRLGELVRLHWLYQITGQSIDRTGPLVLVDRAADLAAIGLLILGAIMMDSSIGMSGAAPVAVFSIAIAFIATRRRFAELIVRSLYRALGLWPRIFARLLRASRLIAPFSSPTVLVPALVLGGIGWFMEGLSFWLLLGWMGADLSLWAAVGIFVASMVMGGATGAPGGLGGAEAAMVGLLSLQGIPLEISIPATAVIRLTTLWFAIALGVVIFPLVTRHALSTAHERKS